MKTWSQRLAQQLCAGLVVGLIAAACDLHAQTTQTPTAPSAEAAAPAAQTASFKSEEIDALVAPIALYPDSLLAQVLMASTYPLEVVQAARWVKTNPSVKGDAAVKAVEGQLWDVSVKSLVAFPQVLQPMDEKLDWTQKLGDAFLAQKEDVFAAVQRLRARAQKSGNLQSNEQQKVTVEPAESVVQPQQTIVRIEPANPEVIYVPAYNPTVVYGAWSAPSYPPYYWPPPPAYYPGYALASGLAWGVGLAAAGAIFSDCDWGGNDVDIDIDRATNIDRNVNRTNIQNGKWQHDPGHRQGVAYRDNATRERYGRNAAGAEARGAYRGREGVDATRNQLAQRSGTADRGAVGDRSGTGDRGGVGDRSGTGHRDGVDHRGGAGDRGGMGDSGGVPGVGDRGQGFEAGAGGDRAGGRDNAFQGVGAGGAAQHDFNRGHSSTQFSGGGRAGGGGMARGGGGGRGGGRR